MALRCSSALNVSIFMAVALFGISVMAQDGGIAPAPPQVPGAGIALPSYGTLLCSSILFSLTALFLQ